MSAVTEEWAAKMWCPHSRVANGQQATNCTINRDGGEAFCRGSACMSWRWVFEEDVNRFAGRTTHFQTNKGYCGLAGKP